MSEEKKDAEPERYKEPIMPYNIHDGGMITPCVFLKESVSYISNNYEVDQSDVWLCTYPKTGTTWTKAILALLHNGCDTKKFENVAIDEYIPFIEASGTPKPPPGTEPPPKPQGPPDPKKMFTRHGYQLAEKMEKPRLVYTHLPWRLLPKSIHAAKPKIIYVYRGPKDVACSYFTFHNNLQLFRHYDNWEYFLEDFVKGDVGFGHYFDHILSYWKERENYGNILFIKYEDMMKDIKGEISKIAQFCGISINNDDVNKVADFCSFDHMKNVKTFDKGDKYKTKGVTKSIFFNKGKAGNWKDAFTVSQSENFDNYCEKYLQGTGFSF